MSVVSSGSGGGGHGSRSRPVKIGPVADPGGAEGAMAPPGPVKIGHKKMATEGGRIDFMFLGPPPPYPAAGSATEALMYPKSTCLSALKANKAMS